MIVLRHIATGAVHTVEGTDGYDMGEWESLGALPAAVPKELVAVDGDVPVVDLDLARAPLLARVDAEAEAIRLRFLTPGMGQAMTYQRKEEEARARLINPLADAPFLSAEANARGVSIANIRDEVIAQADAWIAIGSTIEGLRMGAKSALANATTLSALEAAASIDWEGALAATGA